eukprot:9381634-Pyramimonas_sp.AAC.1
MRAAVASLGKPQLASHQRSDPGFLIQGFPIQGHRRTIGFFSHGVRLGSLRAGLMDVSLPGA